MIPERIRALITAGKTELDSERKAQEEQISRAQVQKQQDETRRRIKRWGFLCVEAKADLGTLSEFVDYALPQDWNCDKDHHWFRMDIPELNQVVAEYKRYNDEWRLTKWGIFHCEHGKQFWVVYPVADKSIEYVLALAREAYLKKEKAERTRPKKKEKEMFDPNAIIPANREEIVDESCGSYHQAVS